MATLAHSGRKFHVQVLRLSRRWNIQFFQQGGNTTKYLGTQT